MSALPSACKLTIVNALCRENRNLKFQRFSRINVPGVALQPEHLGPNQLHYAALGQTPVVIRFPGDSINDFFCCHGLFSSQNSGQFRSPFGYQKFCASRAFCLRLRKNSRLSEVCAFTEVHPRKDNRAIDPIPDAPPFERTDNVSGRYRSVNKFHTAKPTHTGLS
jgi:hypothetical protein